MTIKTKIYAAAASVVVIVMIAALTRSYLVMTKLEKQAASAIALADEREDAAREIESRAAVFQKKIEFLEGELSALRLIADKQDDQIEILTNETAGARSAVDRSRSVRRLASTAADLCSRLAELGHACESRDRETR